ncbi:Threonine/homoserine/homoserine lactone efflux protein [Lutimaribacter pacificus]|uniref:Threonine/homoserine/homoserine lactone efflux protein n=1 Tax=Lutimaribacter pacificus TaxID=391948 RepID=A0A1H0BPF7_9RHOB|nr:LysE family translocator [Lutimaribacter pacificus]SDN47481.1 Threonine/homoserine/homoserine lactone efflux protein [Lutimaribacter pacificus]SHJ53810.1 Threonine/homoserine/homoserine lactone efflux protein [Lutimaribacter pacificus]
MSLEIWLTFVAASTALLFIPGPTVLLVLSYALSQGRKVALASASGVALGDFIAMSASLAGLGALVLASATLFTVLKWVGAAYLVWMGWGLLRSAPSEGLGMQDTAPVPPSGVFRHAAIVTALNPKSIAFFIAFVPQFVNAQAPLMPQFAILIATFVGLAALNALAFALAADRLRRVIARPRVVTGLTRAGGAALIGMGVMTATLRRAA